MSGPPPRAVAFYVKYGFTRVREYDPAIDFFVRVLGLELAEDTPAKTNDGRQKRWVVVRPPGATTGLLLARADREKQAQVVESSSRVALDSSFESMTPRPATHD